MADRQKVTGRTRAGRMGKPIECPHCHHEHVVYHFDWASSKCPGCGEWVDKHDYLLAHPWCERALMIAREQSLAIHLRQNQ